MASLTGHKVKSTLRDEIIKDREGGTQQKDLRKLNYYDLDFGQSMKILFLPDESGELYVTYRTHNVPFNSGIRASTVVCPRKGHPRECPICMHSYETYQNGDRDTARLFRAKDHFLTQAVVLESPIDINETPDNIVKLVNLTYAMKGKIEESVIEQIVDDPTEHAFVIKKTKNSGGYAAYDNSYFRPEPAEIPDVILEAQENGLIQPYSLLNEVPEPADLDELEKWKQSVEDQLKGVSSGQSKQPTGEPQTATQKPSQEPEKTPDEQPEGSKSSVSSLRERLRQQRGEA